MWDLKIDGFHQLIWPIMTRAGHFLLVILTVGKGMRTMSQRATLFLLGIAAVLCSQTVSAQTQIFIENNTDYNLVVSDAGLSSGRLSKKAWKAGLVTVAPGERGRVLSINRTGKFNWMDPTPRFVEPGKTVVFSSDVTVDGIDGASPIKLRQKLLGTGSSSNMWHGIAVAPDSGEQEWVNDDQQYRGTWTLDGENELSYVFRSYADDGETHVEYVFEN